MQIEVNLSNNKDAFLLNNNIPSGVSFNLPTITINKDFSAADIAVTIVISVATGVPSSLVAAWLYDKFKQCRSDQITINRRVINLSDGKVTQIIEESIKVE